MVKDEKKKTEINRKAKVYKVCYIKWELPLRSHQIGNTKHIQGFVWKIKLTVEMKWIKEHFSLSTTDGVSPKKKNKIRNKTSQKKPNHQNLCFGQEIPFVNRMEEHEMAQHEWLFKESKNCMHKLVDKKVILIMKR